MIAARTHKFPARTLLASAALMLPWLLPVLLLLSRTTADITVLLVGSAFLFQSWKNKEWAWVKQPWIKLSLLFWGYLLSINTLNSIQPAETFTYALFFIRWPLFAAALAYWLLLKPCFRRHFILALLAVAAFIVADTWWQYLTGHDVLGHVKASATRLTGPFTKPIPGIMLLRIFFITLFAGLLFKALNSPKRLAAMVVAMLIMGLLTLFITGERMAMILMISGAVVLMLGLWWQYAVLKKALGLAVLLLMGLLITAVLLAPEMANRSVFSAWQKLAHFASSDYGHVFSAAWSAWKSHFWLGSGFHTYAAVCNSMGELARMGMQCSHPHNVYLQISAETGLLGLLLFCTLILRIYHAALAPLMQTRAWFIAALVFVVLSVNFWPLIGGISLLNNWVAALAWLGVAWALSAKQILNTSAT